MLLFQSFPSENSLSDVARDVADLFCSALPVLMWTHCVFTCLMIDWDLLTSTQFYFLQYCS